MEKSLEKMVDPTLAEMGRNLNEAMKMLEDSQREAEEEREKKKYARKDIPGPLQGSGQNMTAILQLVQNLMHGEDEEESQSHRLQNVGEQGHMSLLGHSLAAYISVLDKERLRKLTTRILSDTTLWLCRLFRYENGSAYYHEDDREGLLKVCKLIIHSNYEDYATEGFNVLHNKPPVLYISAACRTGLGQYICNQLGLPISCMCSVPCNTMFGSQHQMDVALLERLIKDDIECGKLPVLLVANAGTPGAGHTDKLARLKELCNQYKMWLHVEGVNLATLTLGYVSSSVLAATKCDSMTLTLGPWLGLPAVPAVTLYRHEDPSLSLAAGLTTSQPVEKLRALPLWLSLQYLGHDGIVNRIKYASQLSQRLLENLRKLSSIRTSEVITKPKELTFTGKSVGNILGNILLAIVEDEFNSPVVVFRFIQDHQKSDGAQYQTAAVQESTKDSNEREIDDALNRWLGEQLGQLVPTSGVDVVELEDEGVCVRFSPLMTAAVLNTTPEHVDQLAKCLKAKIPILISTLQLREEFKQEVYRTAGLTYIEDLNWPGLGAVRYEVSSEEPDPEKQLLAMEKITTGLLKKLKELDSDLIFSTGPEFEGEKNCIYVGMVTDNLDVPELVETIAAMGREIEESSKLLENMTEVVRKGIIEAEQQLQKANEARLLEEGLLRQLPVVGSVLNWLSPVHSSVQGRSFNLAGGSLESTDKLYALKAQASEGSPPPTPTIIHTKHKSPGQKLFRRSSRTSASDTVSETSMGHTEEMEESQTITETTRLEGENEVHKSPTSSVQLNGDLEFPRPPQPEGKAGGTNNDTKVAHQTSEPAEAEDLEKEDLR
ncbi:pyridoxal-dependent decarboxylase domain-containing protein 1 isoform X2 [Chiloscyllium plagiosum]|uniref:pyridoxal-dependent decarboxylase domain-containing protein 1 isoform X2 n=1 Tax=Chiloscyllium plagiosum TaxID=36176 RepID=UPI001CB82315|nr:pyridoxal-dependent decarboxylase domain-containing protein 1 isoform X2 [Chiloscyllium plagiosum]